MANAEALDLAEAASLLIEAAVGRSFFLYLAGLELLLLYEVFNTDEAPSVNVTSRRFELL